MINFVNIAEDESVRFVLNGELVAGGLDALRDTVKKCINNGIKYVEFNMEHVSTLDSAGIGFLAATHNSLLKCGGMIKVTKLSDDMYNFFVSLRLNSHFNVEKRK